MGTRSQVFRGLQSPAGAAKITPAMKPEEKLATLRDEIDEIDARLVELLNARAQRVLEIRDLKREAGMDPTDEDRERAIVERVIEANPGPLNGHTLKEIFELILRRFKEQ